MNARANTNAEHHNRHSIRLQGYDYSKPGAYFVTMCVHNRECLFGEIVNGEIRLNKYGEIVHFTWNDLTNHVGNIVLDEFVIMPNHVHGIIILVGAGSVEDGIIGAGSFIGMGSFVGAGSEPAPTKEPAPANAKKSHPLPEIIRQFKTFSARRINQNRKMSGISVWQRNFYDHIGRNEKDINRIRQYIKNNPLNWNEDEENPLNRSPRHVVMLNPQKRYLKYR